MPVRIIRSGRSTISIQVTGEGELVVRAPYRVSDSQIAEFVREKSAWIQRNLAKVQKRRQEEAATRALSMQQLQELAERAAQVLPQKTKHYAELMGVTYGHITIRNQKTRWGSCSSKGNLNFNCILMRMPEEIQDYVVVHELCHRKEMNHSIRFWQEVEKVLPDYRSRRKWLKEYGSMAGREPLGYNEEK